MADLVSAPTPMPYPSWRIVKPKPVPHNDVGLGSDGDCTGLPSNLVPPELLKCCIEHDAGGRDGVLLDCANDALPGVPIVLVCLFIFLMALFRPIYNRLQRWGWVR